MKVEFKIGDKKVETVVWGENGVSARVVGAVDPRDVGFTERTIRDCARQAGGEAEQRILIRTGFDGLWVVSVRHRNGRKEIDSVSGR